MATGEDERLRFHALVAASMLGIAQRSSCCGTSTGPRTAVVWSRLGVATTPSSRGRSASGSLDDRFDDVTAAVRDAVTDKLVVANPRHLATPGG